MEESVDDRHGAAYFPTAKLTLHAFGGMLQKL